MPMPGKRPGRPGRERRPAGRMKPENPLQRELRKKTAGLQIFLYEELPGLGAEKRKGLEALLKQRGVIAKNGGLKDLERVIANAVMLSSAAKAGAKQKSILSPVKNGAAAVRLRAAFAAISEAKKNRVI